MKKRTSRQGGWVGLIGMLLALAIVAWLSRDALKSYLSLPTAPTVTTHTGTPGAAARAAGGIGPAEIDLSSPTAPPQSAIGRARGLEDTVKQQAEQRANQLR